MNGNQLAPVTHKRLVPASVVDALPHDGIGTRADWLGAGASERMFRDGALRRVARGVYVAAHDERQVSAARLASLLPDDCAIGGWAAAMEYGVRDAGPTMMTAEPDEVLAYPGRNMHKRPPGFRVLRTDLAAGDATVINGIRMTTPLRTAYDMVRFAPSLLIAVGILDCFLYELNPNPVDADDLNAVLEAHPRARGNARVRAALLHSSTRSRSIPESHLRARLGLDCGLWREDLMVNAELELGGNWYEVDLIDRSSGMVLEYDSRFHTDTRQRGLDAAKDVAVDEAGLVMRRINAPLLRSPRELVHAVAERRATARERGSDVRLAELARAQRIRMRPLRP